MRTRCASHVWRWMRDLTSIKSWSQRSALNHNYFEGAKNNHSIPCRHDLPSNLCRSHLCVTEYLTPNPKKVHSESDVAHEVIVCSNLFLLLSGGGSYPSRHQNPLPSCHQNPCYHTNHKVPVWWTMSSCYTEWDGRTTQSRGMRLESTLWQSLWWRVSCQGVLFEWQHCRQAYISLLMVDVLAWRPTYWTSWNEKFCKLTIRIMTVVMSTEPTRLDCVGRRLEVEVRSQDWHGSCEVAEGWMPVRWDGQQNYFLNFSKLLPTG